MGLSLKRTARYTPRGPRTGVQLATSFVLADDRLVPVKIENLSPNGFMAKVDEPLAENTWLGVELLGYGIVRARVRWSEDGEVGCQFRKAIDLAVLGEVVIPPPAKPLFRQAGRAARTAA